MPATSAHSHAAEPAAPPALSRLVVGVDGSDGAHAAAAFALWLAGTAGAKVTLLHACPPPDPAPAAELHAAVIERAAGYELEWARRLDALRDYAADDARVSCRLVHAAPAAALVAVAGETGADAILVGSHGLGRLRHAVLGSVSAQVLLHAPCSVMVFREGAADEPASHARTVVVGVDGSEPSAYAVEVAQALAVPLAARLALVHAYETSVPFAGEPTSAFRRELEHHGRQVLHDARATVSAPLDVVDEQLRAGRARDVLAAACDERAPALLVVGSRGLGGFRELLLGSTSRWVANVARCPVLVARARPQGAS